MNKRQLGNSDLYLAPLAFGGNVLGWTIDEQQSFKVLDAFVGAGLNFIDTADVYSRWATGNKGGESETIIGNWMQQRKNRAAIIIATKVGGDMGQGKKDISKAYILKAVEDSLQRLQTDHIDLYQTHWDDDVTPVEETLEAYAQLIREGKIKWIGASNLSPQRLNASLEASNKFGYPKYQSFQPEYNLYTRDKYEKELEQLCVDNHLGVISYFSLASGFLTGKYRSEADFGKSVRGGNMSKYLNPRGLAILKALDDVAARHDAEPATIALAWIMARPSVTAPIASATTVEQMQTLAKATKITLTQEDIEVLDKASKW